MRLFEEVELFQSAVEIGAGLGPGVGGVMLFEVGVRVTEVSSAMG